MNTLSTVLDNASAEATPGRSLQTALAAWKQNNFVEVAFAISFGTSVAMGSALMRGSEAARKKY
jgi:hypothetical protein